MMGVPMAYWSGHVPYNNLYCQLSNKDQKLQNNLSKYQKIGFDMQPGSEISFVVSTLDVPTEIPEC